MKFDSVHNICVITLGGTIAMDVKEGQGAAASRESEERLLKTILNLSKIGKDQPLARPVAVEKLMNIDGTNVLPGIYEALIAKIGELYEQYDGFLVTTGTNTLGYLSSALSFGMQEIRKPVVVTGAQISNELPWSDALNNLRNSLRWLYYASEFEYAGVYVVFGSKIIRGTRAKKITESSMDAFDSFGQASPIGELSRGITLYEQPEKIAKRGVFQPEAVFERKVISITITPGTPPEMIDAMLNYGLKGLIFRSYGTGDIPEALFPCLRLARELEVPVVNTTQCPQGVTLMGADEIGYEALKLGVIPALDMSMEAMDTKMRWLLGRKTDYKHFPQQMLKNMVGEITSALGNSDDYWRTGIRVLARGGQSYG